MKNKTPEELLSELELVTRLAENANKRAEENERILRLLVAAGIVDEDKISQARAIAQWK